MGIRIKASGADFSASGLGSSNWVKTYAQRAGVTDPTKVSALQALYDSCVSANIWSKIGGIAPFPGSTTATQKYIFSEIAFGGSFPEIEFVGNGSSVDGWTPASGVYARLPYTPSAGNKNNLSFGIYNNTAESAPTVGGANSVMLSTNGEAALLTVADYRIELGRHWGSPVSPLGKIGTRDGGTTNQTFPATGTTDMTRKKLIQIVKDGVNLRLIDDGATVSTKTDASQVPTGGGSRKLMLGARMDNSGNADLVNFSKARVALAYWGTLTLAEAVTFNTIVNTFVTAFGRAL